jgi:uncharacterized protein YndB with AHSA1/START domain
MVDEITATATYRHAPAAVWEALTRADALSAWLMDNDASAPLATGTRFSFRDRPRPFWDGVCPVEVQEATAPERLVLRWNTRQGKAASTVTFSLSPTADGGTRLDFRHAGLVGVAGWFMRVGMTKGWQGMVARAIPFVVDGLAHGQVPSREATKAVRQQR